jgi:hypothetical protein
MEKNKCDCLHHLLMECASARDALPGPQHPLWNTLAALSVIIDMAMDSQKRFRQIDADKD